METTQILLALALIFGFYMAWNIGANDVANAMGTSVGSGALTLKQAVIVAAIFEFLGAWLVGANVTETIRKGIFDDKLLEGLELAYGMIAALLAAGVWLQIASYYGWPVSTTHSIVGAVVGFGCVAVGVQQIHWNVVGKIAASWVISPLLAGTLSFITFGFLLKHVFYQKRPVEAAKRITPYLTALVVFVLAGVTGLKGLKHFFKENFGWEVKNIGHDDFMWEPYIMTFTIGLIAAFISLFIAQRFVKNMQSDDEDDQENGNLDTLNYISRRLTKAKAQMMKVVNNGDSEMQLKASHVMADMDKMAHETRVEIEKNTVKKDSSAPTAHSPVERIFVYLQILSACFVAFAHGANDVANAIGPLAAAYSKLTGYAENVVPPGLLLLGGVGIIIGLATWGWRVIETVGKKITELTPSRGFCAEFGAAITILMASIFGLPISTTHTLVGAVLGVGLARGLGALNLKTIRDIGVSWVITIPAGAFLSIIFYFILKAIFN
ncbi:anion permease [bacterium AH-315-E10]|nr:anion permease [bacterium AH-315-E10]